MGFKIPPILVIVALVCAGVGLLFQIVGLATPAWVTWDVLTIKVESGLWELCSDGTCAKWDSELLKDWQKACQAFGILGVLVLVGSVVVGVLICFMENDKLPLVGAATAFAAAFCILIEFATYVNNTTVGSSISYGYSFALTVLAFLLALAAGICFIAAKFKP